MSSDFVPPVTLARDGMALVPLGLEHAVGLEAAAGDGELWNIRVTSVPAPGEARAYIEAALGMEDRRAFAVLESDSGTVLGTTSFHDILPPVRRLEIGYTWYARRVQRTAVNTVCKLLLLEHAFERLACRVVGFRTDNFNSTSQRAIERLGAHRDGVIRGHVMRRDGTIRDTVMYSITSGEWPEVRAHLLHLLAGGEGIVTRP